MPGGGSRVCHSGNYHPAVSSASRLWGGKRSWRGILLAAWRRGVLDEVVEQVGGRCQREREAGLAGGEVGGSVGSDSDAGSRVAERLPTVLASRRQHGRPLRDFLVAAGEAAVRGTPAPSPLPAPQGG